MKCCGIYFRLCNPFSVYFFICFYIFEIPKQSRVCMSICMSLCCKMLFGEKIIVINCALILFFKWCQYNPMLLLT
jgi:hypothetical protein